jgi:hypothetical protein
MSKATSYEQQPEAQSLSSQLAAQKAKPGWLARLLDSDRNDWVPRSGQRF